MKMRWLFSLLLITFVLPGCQKSPREAEVSGEAQGTTYHIKLVLDNTSPPVEEIRRQISATLAEIDEARIATLDILRGFALLGEEALAGPEDKLQRHRGGRPGQPERQQRARDYRGQLRKRLDRNL